MAKARAIVKRRKAVRNIRIASEYVQMIATAKFQKALRRAVGTKPYTLKVREVVGELAATVGEVDHPLLRKVTDADRKRRVALIVITSNRGLAGAYNGSVLRAATAFIRQQEAAGNAIDLYVVGKKGIAYFTFQKRPIKGRMEVHADTPTFLEVERGAAPFVDQFVGGDLDAVYVAYMNFISTGQQKPEVMQLLPLAGVAEALDEIGRQSSEKEAQLAAGALDARRSGDPVAAAPEQPGVGRLVSQSVYDFSPDPRELFDYLLPLTVKTALFQAFLDAVSSENVARMVAMKSATDNADKMAKSLTMQYNRARQSQITTELAEIMGGVESMKK